MTSGALFVAVFLACAVEAVEATTIVLAAGLSRGWRSSAAGLGAALLVLAAVVASVGPALARAPLGGLRLVVGALLLVFGLQWLRKAVLRAGGALPVRDERAIYDRELAAAATTTRRSRPLVPDWYGFTLSFKGVLLEGLEVAFIVVTFGASQGQVPLAALAALAAIAVVAAAGFAVRHPLARVPENTMKFAVGVMLTSFGVFWGAEGAGAHWPGSDAALLALVPAVALLALLQVAVLRRRAAQRRPLPADL